MNPDDNQNSLMNAIQGYASMLAQIHGTNMGLGVNPQIQQTQQNVDLARTKQAQSILDTPTGQTGQNWVQNTGPDSYSAQLQGLLARGPDMSGVSGGVNAFGFNPGPAQRQQALNDYNQQIADARVGMITDTKILTPAERQMRDEAVNTARLDNASGLLAGTKPDVAVDPQQFGLMATIAQKQAESNNTLAGEKYKTQGLLAQNQLQQNTELAKAKILNEGDLAKQQLANQGNLAVANVQALNKPPTTYELDAQKKADEATQMLNQVSDLANQFKPEFFLTSTKIGDAVRQEATQKGFKLGADNPDYNNFQSGLNQMALQYMKYTGVPSRGMSQDAARKYFLKGFIPDNASPQEAASGLVDAGARLHVAATIAQQNVVDAARRGQHINPEDPAQQERVRKATDEALKGNGLAIARSAFIEQHPNLNLNQANPIAPTLDYSKLSDADLDAQIAAAQGVGVNSFQTGARGGAPMRPVQETPESLGIRAPISRRIY